MANAMDNRSYTIRYGDTLSSIAGHYEIPLTTLAAANNLAPPYKILAGEVLRVPTGAIRRAQEQPQSSHHARREQDAIREDDQPPSYAAAGNRHHIVGPGESLSDIGYRYGLGIGELAVANAIESLDEIKVGQKLIIPPSEEALNRRAQKLAETRRQQAVEVIAAPPLSSRGFLWPVDGAVIQTFKESYAAGESGAISISATIGTPVRATNHGVVVFAGEVLDRYGQMIVLRHAGDYTSLYAHNDDLHVEEGDIVSRGQVISSVGNSGIVDAGQLRFELRRKLEPIDPERILGKRPDLHRTVSMLLIKN